MSENPKHQLRRDVDGIIRQLWRQYPEWPSTFGPCANDCGLMGRGSGPCAYCLEEELSNVLGGYAIDETLARNIHQSIQEYKENYNCVLDHIKGGLYTHEEDT